MWRNVRDGVRASQPGKRAARRTWRNKPDEVLLPLLWQDEREQAVAQLQRVRPTIGEMPAALDEVIRSLETQKDWLGNDEQWQAGGLWPGGAGCRYGEQ
jgi:hypothetical protein